MHPRRCFQANRVPRRGSLPRFPTAIRPPSNCPAYSDRLLRVQTDRMPGYVPQAYRYPLQTSNNYGWMVMYKDLNPPSQHGRRDIYKVLGWPTPT